MAGVKLLNLTEITSFFGLTPTESNRKKILRFLIKIQETRNQKLIHRLGDSTNPEDKKNGGKDGQWYSTEEILRKGLPELFPSQKDEIDELQKQIDHLKRRISILER